MNDTIHLKASRAKRILIVDDDVAFTEIFKEFLLSHRPGTWVVHTADHYAPALTCLKENRIDLIVLDLNMPVMDGLQLLSMIKRTHPAIPVVLIVAFGLRETGVVTRVEARPPFTLKPFDLNFRLYLLSLLIFTLGNSSDLFLLQRGQELGISTKEGVALWLVFHLVKSFGNFRAGKLTDRIGPRPMIWAGWFVYAAAYLAFAFANAAWQIWALFLVYGVFYSLTEPAEKTLVASLVGPERKGLAFGWFNLTIGIGALPANIFFGWLYQHYGPLAAFGSGAGLAFAAALLLLAVRPQQE